MVDFLKVKVNRLSDSVVLQHLWNSIDDLLLCEIHPSKTNVIERCKTVYGVETNEINKNLFLALKEGTISRNVKTDILSRIEVKEDKACGDWYCFLCHKVGPDTRCRRCGTSFHNTCNCDLSDQFHCHTCRSTGQFSTDFQKFSSTTQLRIIRRVIYPNKIKWQSLNVVGYIHDDSRNNFFIYKAINATEMDKRLSSGKYFSTDKSSENFLFDLLLLRHNCAVIYGNEHEFSKTITGYIKHLYTEIENIYCESCFLLFSKVSSHKLSTSQKQEVFCSVCSVRHPIMWGLVPPNVFWPFKMISEDNERYYGIKFSRTIQFNRQKLEPFSKEISLVWSSYNLTMCDRPSLELLKAFSLAQLYAQNLLEAKRLSDPSSRSSSIRSKKEIKKKGKIFKSSQPCKSEVQIQKRKIGRPPKQIVGRPPKNSKVHQKQLEKKSFLNNLSSTESSSESVNNSIIINPNIKKRKRIKDVFGSEDEKPRKISKQSGHNKRQRKHAKKYKPLSSNDSESNSDDNVYTDSDVDRINKLNVRTSFRTHQPQKSSSSSHASMRSQSKLGAVHRYLPKHRNERVEEECYSSSDTIPQRVSNLCKVYSSDDSLSESEINEVLSRDDIRCRKSLTRRRPHCNLPTSSKYSAYSSSASPSYNYTPDNFSKDHIKNIYKDTSLNRLPSSGKDLQSSQSRNSNLETGLYCSSSSPVNFSPLSNNHQTNVAQVSMQSTPSSNYQMSLDESTYQSGSNFNMKIILKNRAFQMSSPLQLGINVDPKIGNKTQNTVNSVLSKKEDFATSSKITRNDYSDSD